MMLRSSVPSCERSGPAPTCASSSEHPPALSALAGRCHSCLRTHDMLGCCAFRGHLTSSQRVRCTLSVSCMHTEACKTSLAASRQGLQSVQKRVHMAPQYAEHGLCATYDMSVHARQPFHLERHVSYGHTGDEHELTSVWYQLLLMQPQNVCADVVHEVLHTEHASPRQQMRSAWLMVHSRRRKPNMHKARCSNNHLGVADEEEDALELLQCLLQPHACFQV